MQALDRLAGTWHISGDATGTVTQGQKGPQAENVRVIA